MLELLSYWVEPWYTDLHRACIPVL